MKCPRKTEWAKWFVDKERFKDCEDSPASLGEMLYLYYKDEATHSCSDSLLYSVLAEALEEVDWVEVAREVQK